MWEFANGKPYLAFFIVVLLVFLARSVLYRISHMWSRWLRSQNIKRHGWPTAPIDADGDVIRPISAEQVADALIKRLEDDEMLVVRCKSG